MIRLATVEDALQIAQVHVQSWKETYTGLVKQEILDRLNVAQRKVIWQHIISLSDHYLFVYEQDGNVLGFLDGCLDKEKAIAEIKAFYLLKQIQKQGIGQKMFEQFYQIAKIQNYHLIQVEVFAHNPSRLFYEKLGAQVFAEQALPDYGEGVKALFYQWEIKE